VSVLESLRVYLKTFTLANVIAEIERWRHTGESWVLRRIRGSKRGAEARQKRDFQGMALVSNGGVGEAPGGLNHQEPDAPLAHRRAGYPLLGCVPAEPESVSQATGEFSE
jgi:hypothetical protein